jgi:hypothetical protein
MEIDNKKILELIKNECQPYINSINDMDKNRLRRGMTFNSPFKKMNEVGDGRNESMDDVEWEMVADDILYKKFGGATGWPGNRFYATKIN